MKAYRGLAAMAATALALAGCATRDVRPHEAGLASIEIAAGPCFGACPVYRATIEPSGAGHFAGARFTAVTGDRPFIADPATFTLVADALAPYRPARDRAIGPAKCERFRTDAPRWTVRWTDRDGAAVSLDLYLGCTDARYGPMAQAIRTANDLLPIGDLVGKR
jgi:hypothetical protein